MRVQAHQGIVVSDMDELFQFVDRQVADGRRVLRGSVKRQLRLRERHGSTAIGAGIAVPHAAVRWLRRTHLIYTQLDGRLPMKGPDGQPIREALTLLVRYPASAQDHLLLERLRNPNKAAPVLDLLRQGRCEDVATQLLTV